MSSDSERDEAISATIRVNGGHDWAGTIPGADLKGKVFPMSMFSVSRIENIIMLLARHLFM